jgi:hypothetical protein
MKIRNSNNIAEQSGTLAIIRTVARLTFMSLIVATLTTVVITMSAR